MNRILIVALAACGAHHGQVSSENASFICHDRSVSYMATLGGGAEMGVQMDCKDNGPRIKRWTTDKAGAHKEDTRSLDPSQFEKVWTQVDGTGWPNLRDCANGTGGKTDPVYTFDVKDDQNKVSFTCQTREMPYPYNDISDPLNLAANQGQPQLGDDEPADAKALDKKDMQK